MVAAALTGGDVTVTDCNPHHLTSVIEKLRQTGVKVDIVGDTAIRINGNGHIKSTDIKTIPYPGFPTDMQAQFMVLMSRC